MKMDEPYEEFHPSECGWVREPNGDIPGGLCYELPCGQFKYLRADLPQILRRYKGESDDK